MTFPEFIYIISENIIFNIAISAKKNLKRCNIAQDLSQKWYYSRLC